MSKISTIPEVEKDDLRAGLEKLKRTLPVLLEYAALDARIRKAKYDACIAEGFGPQQALEIAKGHL